MRRAALVGLGLVMQPEVLLADDLASGQLVAVLQACAPPARPVHLVYAADRRQLPKLSRFVAHVLRSLGLLTPAPGRDARVAVSAKAA